MSNFTAIGLIMALAVLSMFLYILMVKWARDRTYEIATGFVRGGPISTEDRRSLLNTTWLEAVGASVGFQSVMSIAWVLLGRSTSAEEVRLLAYMFAFITLATVLGWIAISPFGYSRLASILRQAEAD